MIKQITVFFLFSLSLMASAGAQTETSDAAAPARDGRGAAKGVVSESRVSPAKHRVVIQLSSPDSLAWKGLMKNLEHLKEGWGDSVQIEVVVHAAGIDMLVTAKTTVRKDIAAFTQKGVVFVACENTLRGRNIPKTAIIPEAGFVPMGVGELILKQEQGWSYLKAGF